MDIRSALVTDADRLAKLLYKLHKMHVESHPLDFKELSLASAAEFLHDKLKQDSTICLIAEKEQAISGYLLAEIVNRSGDLFMRDRKILYGHHLLVEPDMRGRHISKQLLSKTEAFARQLECDLAVLDVWAFNSRSVALYERLGFSKTSFQMTKEFK